MNTTAAIDRVEREDIALFIGAGLACTGQAEYYADRGDVAVSVAFLHDYVRTNYRALYARSLAAGINDFSRTMIVQGLLAAGAPSDPEARAEEGALIEAALATMPPQRVYRLFRRLQTARVNNRRTKATIRRFLARRDLVFDGLKYRPGLRAAARHAHGPLPGELGPLLFKRPRVLKRYETPLFETWRKAHFSTKALFDLPMTVAEGLAAHHRMDRRVFYEKIAHQMTEGERLRSETAARRSKAKLSGVDLSRMGATRLVLHAMARPRDARADSRDPLATAARRIADRLPPLGHVAAVLDRSRSTSGSREKARRPLAVALAIDAVLRAHAATHDTAYSAHWTVPPRDPDDPFAIDAYGQTDLARPLVDALATRPDVVVLVSDGFENVGPGAANAVVSVARARLKSTARVIHVSPVFDPETYAPRPLGPDIVTVGARTAADLPLALRLARFIDGTDDLDALHAWLGGRARRLIERGVKP